MIVSPANQPADLEFCDSIFTMQLQDDFSCEDLPVGKPAVHSVPDLIHAELSRSGFPLHGIRCSQDGDAVHLTGTATQFYYVQIALKTALRHAGEYRVVNQIEVLPASPR